MIRGSEEVYAGSTCTKSSDSVAGYGLAAADAVSGAVAVADCFAGAVDTDPLIYAPPYSGFSRSEELDQSRYGKKSRYWPYIQKSHLLGSASREPSKKTKAKMVINRVLHVSSGGPDSGLELLRGFHKNPLDGVDTDADAVDLGATVNFGQVAGLQNEVWFRAGKGAGKCAVVKIATAGLPKKSYFPASFADTGPVGTDGAGKTSVVTATIEEVVDPKAGVAFITAAVTVYPVIVAAMFSEIQGTESPCSVPGRIGIRMWGRRCSCSNPVWVRSGLGPGMMPSSGLAPMKAHPD